MRPGYVLAQRFEIESLAGAGGVGTIYRARDLQTSERVAVKVLRLEGVEHQKRFAREVRALEVLTHPAIVRFVAHGKTDEGQPFVAMEWVEGVTLQRKLVASPLGVDDALNLARRVAKGLAFAHARGVVHRDINPNNLLLPGGKPEEAKIVDFGLALLGETTLTVSGTVLGTPGFMAPEQVRGETDVDSRADVFALGCVLFRALTGNVPFDGNIVARLAKVLFESAPHAREQMPGLPWALDDLIHRMLSQDRDTRPRDGRAALVELRRMSDGLPTDPSMKAAKPWDGTITTEEQRFGSIVVALGWRGRAHQEVLERARKAGAPSGARVEVLVDGTIVARLWGAGSARDQAKQAARCALSLRDALEGGPIALATGRAASGSSGFIGEVIERATELLLAHEPKTPTRRRPLIAIDATTAALLDPEFDVVEDGAHLGLRRERPQAGGEAARTLLGRPTAFVGREREMRVLEAVFAECTEDSVSHAVIISAPSGAGKSRLRHEFVWRVHAHDVEVEVWTARGDPMSAGSPLGMIAQIVRGAAGIQEGETLSARQTKLVARVSRHIGGGKLTRVTEFLGEIAGVPFPEKESVQLQSARRSPQLMGDQMRRAWEEFIAAECDAQPVLVVLEDLHWGDLPTVTFVDGALGNLRDKPLMVLALGQPDVHRLFPQLWEDHPRTELRLGELSKRASERLARQVLGANAKDEEILRVVDQAAGNAFYLEELIRSVAEGQGELPPTVLAMVQARLASLEPESRRVLRAASVFGGTFWKAGVASLVDQADAALGARLDDLVKRELVILREPGRFASEYTFRHAIVREAAYSMLTESDRVLGHKLAGAWLEAAGETDAMALAEQFERGGQPARAVAWYARAATQALEGNDFDAVIARVKKGVACGAEGEQRGALFLLEAQAHKWRGELAEMESTLQHALAALPRGSAGWYEAAGAVVSTRARSGVHGNLEPLVLALCDESLGRELGALRVGAWAHALGPLYRDGFRALADELYRCILRTPVDLNDPSVAARIHQARAVRALDSGDRCAFLVQTDAAVHAFEHAGDLRSACVQRAHSGYAKMRLGAYADAEATLRKALAEAEHLRLPAVATVARQNLGLALAHRGALHEARAVEELAVEGARGRHETLAIAGTQIYLAEILALAGNYAAAERAARESLATLGTRLREVRLYALATLSQILRAQNRTSDALATSGEAMTLLESHRAVTESGEMAYLAHAEALHSAGQADAARVAIGVAKTRLLSEAEKLGDPALKRGFLDNVPTNIRILRLAEEWG